MYSVNGFLAICHDTGSQIEGLGFFGAPPSCEENYLCYDIVVIVPYFCPRS